MRTFNYTATDTADSAIAAVTASPEAVFFAGGTTLIDLMKLEVMTPSHLIDVSRLAFNSIESPDVGRILIGANVKNSDLAHHPLVREHFPVLSEALLAGASAQLRNMATTAGNLMQKTRCGYFRDVNAKCNKRAPGSGCDAMTGVNREHAILGTSEHCIATHHSDMCAALAILDTVIHTKKSDGSARAIPINDFYLLPDASPHRETVLEHGELITGIELRPLPVARNSHYLKVRDRSSYEFALASAAVALDVAEGKVAAARVGFGGIATRPWRSYEAEAALVGKAATSETFKAAANAALAGARLMEHNAFKLNLAKSTLVFALEELQERV